MGLLFHESFSMVNRSSGFRIDESGLAPAALMSSSTAMSHEKVRRAEGTCGGGEASALFWPLHSELISLHSNLRVGIRSTHSLGHFLMVTPEQPSHSRSIPEPAAPSTEDLGSGTPQIWLRLSQCWAAVSKSSPFFLKSPHFQSHLGSAPQRT